MSCRSCRSTGCSEPGLRGSWGFAARKAAAREPLPHASRPDGGVVTQRTANPCTPVRFRLGPPLISATVCAAGANPRHEIDAAGGVRALQPGPVRRVGLCPTSFLSLSSVAADSAARPPAAPCRHGGPSERRARGSKRQQVVGQSPPRRTGGRERPPAQPAGSRGSRGFAPSRKPSPRSIRGSPSDARRSRRRSAPAGAARSA